MIVACFIALFVFFVIKFYRIIRNYIFIYKIDRYSDKLKILNLDYHQIARAIIYLSIIYMNNTLYRDTLLSASEAGLNDAFYEIQYYNICRISNVLVIMLFLILEFVPSIISSEYLYDNLVKRYPKSEITYQSDENEVILYHENYVILKIQQKKKYNEVLEKILETYKMKEERVED